MQKTMTLSLTALFLVSFLVGIAPMASAQDGPPLGGPYVEDGALGSDNCGIEEGDPVSLSGSCDELEKTLCVPEPGSDPEADILCTEEDVIDVFAGEGEETEQPLENLCGVDSTIDSTINGQESDTCDEVEPDCTGMVPMDTGCIDVDADAVLCDIPQGVGDAWGSTLGSCGPLIENEAWSSSGPSDEWAKDGDTITLTFDSTDAINDVTVSFQLGGTEFANVGATDTSGGAETSWSAEATAPADAVAAGDITAVITFEDSDDTAQDPHDAVGGVTLDNEVPDATVTFDNANAQGFVDNTAETDVQYTLTITETNQDDTSSSHEWDANDGNGPTTENVEDGSYAGDIPATGGGTFDVDLTIRDMAGNEFIQTFSIGYHGPDLTVMLSSDNVKDDQLAIDGDTITIEVLSPEALTGFTVESMTIGGSPVSDPLPTPADVNGDGFTWTVEHTVAGGDGFEGDVEFELDWDGLTDFRTATTDGSGVTVDLTPPSFTSGSPQMLPNGKIGVGETEDVLVSLIFDSDLDKDAAFTTGTVTGTPDDTDADPEVVNVDFSTLTGVEDEDAGTITFEVTVPNFGPGTLNFAFDAEDLAGNQATGLPDDPLDVQIITERITATITEGGMDAADDIRYVGQGAFAARTYEVTVTHEVLDADEAEDVSVIAVDLTHTLGEAVSVPSINSGSDMALVFYDDAGAAESIEVELDSPLTDGNYVFSFTVANNEAAGGGMVTGDDVVMNVETFSAAFEQLGHGILVSTTMRADTDGPTVSTLEFPIDTDDSGEIDYLEFIADEDGIVADISGITDTGGSGAVAVELVFRPIVCDDADPPVCGPSTDFVSLGTATLDPENLEASISVDETLLGHGDVEFAAFATDAVGNVGSEFPVVIDIAIQQFLVVSPAEEPVWVSPTGSALVSFEITPDDVVQDLKRYDLRVGNDEYALSAFLAPNTFSGTNGDQLVLVRHNGPSNTAPWTVVDATVMGSPSAAHLTESEFDLIALNTDGKSGPLTIVDEDYNAFTGPVFTATVDAEAPDLTFVEIEEPADENGNYAAGTGEVLTFTFTVSDDDSGLPDTDAVDIEVYDSDADSWSSVAGAVLDITEGTIEIPREDPGRFTYRLTAVDNVGNLAFDESIGEINVLGVVTATIDSIGVQQDADGDSTFADLGALGGVFYADLDSDVPGDDAGDADQVLFTANVLLDGTPEGGVTVELHFGDGIVLTTTTDDDGDATWLVDPDDHDLDLASTPFDVVVPSQEFSGETADFVVTGDSDSTEVLWTGFYLDVGGDSDADLETPFDLDAGLYWLHDVFVAGAIDLTGASTIDAGAFTGSIGLTESVGGQEMTAVNVPAESGTAPTFSVTRGTGPVPGVDVDTEAGYREYTPFVDGDLPAGMAGTGFIVAEGHEVLISGVRLVFDSIDQLGVAGDDASVEVSAQWLHDTLLDGTTAETRSIGDLSFDLITDKPSVFGTGPHTLGAGQASLVVDDVFESGTVLLTAGESADDGLFPVVYDATAEMHGMDVGFFPVGGVADDVITPGGDFAGDFAIVIDSVPVDDAFPGVAHSLSVNLAGDAATDTVFDAVPISGQSPFSIVDSADQVQTPSVPIAYDGGASAWTFELGTPDLGIYSLEVSLVVSDNGGAPVTVGLSDPFSVKYEVYRITEDETTQGASTLTSEDGTFWVDRDVTSDVTHAFFVDIVESDGESDTEIGPALDGTVVQVWSSDDDGTTWTQFGTDITLSSGGDTGEASFDIPRSEDSVADTLFRIVVTEDHIGTPLDNSDGLGDATLPYDTRFIFTGVTVDFIGDGDDLTQLVDEDVPVTVEATYDHNGAPVEALEVTIDATGLGAPVVVTTGATGMAATMISLDAPGVIDDLDATITGGLPHGLTATTDEVYDGTLTWVDLRTGDLLVEADSGSGFAPVDEDSETAGLYTVPAGSFVKVTVPVELDDGTTTTDIESGTVFFGATSKAISGGEAVNTYFRSSAGTSGDVPLSVEDATAGGTNYGDLPDAGSFKIVWE